MMRLLLTLAALVAVAPALAQLPPPVRTMPIGEIVVATSPALAPTVRTAAAAFERVNPALRVRIEAAGSDVAMTLLYTGAADVSVIGRTATEPELKAYEWVYLRPPASRAIMRGGISAPGHSPTLAVRVHQANPLQSISVERLVALFRPGSRPPVWGDLGATGPLATRSVRLVIPDIESGTGRFLRTALLEGATQLAWDRTTEIGEDWKVRDPGRVGRRIAQVVARDMTAIGIGEAMPQPGTRIVPLLASDASPRSSLERQIMAYSHQQPTAATASFLRFLQADTGDWLDHGPYRTLE